MLLGPDLIYRPKLFLSTAPTSKNSIGGTYSTRYKKHNDPTVIFAFQDLLQISPDIFQGFVSDILISKKPVLAKEKGVFKKKKTPGLIQGRLVVRSGNY